MARKLKQYDEQGQPFETTWEPVKSKRTKKEEIEEEFKEEPEDSDEKDPWGDDWEDEEEECSEQMTWIEELKEHLTGDAINTCLSIWGFNIDIIIPNWFAYLAIVAIIGYLFS